MKSWIVAFLAAIFIMAPEPVMADTAALAPSSSAGTSSALDFSRWTVGAEALGPAVLYSVFGSYRIIKQLAVNVGLSYWPSSDSSTYSSATVTSNVFMFPASVSGLFGGKNSNFEVTGGATLMLVSGAVKYSTSTSSFTQAVDGGSALIPFLGAGYRLWPENGGFSFRAMLYTLFLPVPKSSVSVVSPVQLWPGFSFGYAF